MGIPLEICGNETALFTGMVLTTQLTISYRTSVGSSEALITLATS
jgi:hypothetical protein